MKWMILPMLLVLVSPAMAHEGAVEAATQPSSASPSFTSRYGVIVEGNMFLRDRRRAVEVRPTGPSSRPAPPPALPERSLVLTGIVVEQGEIRAYFEDLSKLSIVRVVPGDAIARGHVSMIMIDALEYEHEGNTIWIEVGQDLLGEARTAAIAGSSGTPRSTGADEVDQSEAGAAAVQPGETVDPATLSIAERLRLRRQQGQ